MCKLNNLVLLFRETLLRSCWHKAPTKRPSASEVVELLSNNPRLISPCIDVPLASVQVERTDSLELIPNMKGAVNSSGLTKSDGSSFSRPMKLLYRRSSRDLCPSNGIVKDLSIITMGSSGNYDIVRDAEYNSGAYSPMTGNIPNGGIFHVNSNNHEGNYDNNCDDNCRPLEMIKKQKSAHLLTDYDEDECTNLLLTPPVTSSYVPPGYIVLDHRSNGATNKHNQEINASGASSVSTNTLSNHDKLESNEYVPTTVSSV